jgi:MAF protein
MRAAGFDFEVRPSRAVEWPYRGGDPAEHAESLARAKAAAADGELVVGADTIVVLDGAVLGKPRSPDDAASTLQRLSGRTHEVITAAAVRDGPLIRWGHARTRVTFRPISHAEILDYVGTGEPLDKAGSYALQGGAAAFVERVDGDADTVIGLPVSLLRRLLAVGDSSTICAVTTPTETTSGGRASVCDLDDPRWTSFVAEHPEAGPFHHGAWPAALAAAYGFRPLLLALTDGRGRLRAGMPLMEVRSRLTGHRFVCLPFTDYCPPLAESAEALSDLVREVVAWSQASGSTPVEVHAELPAGAGVHPGARALRHTLALDPDGERLFRSFRASIPRAIRKAERSGVEVRLGRSRAELDVYYRLHCETRHRQGVPVQPRRFFGQLWEQLLSRDLGFTALAYHGGRPIAGAVFLAWKGTLVYKYGASDQAHWALRPNNLVMWKAMEWGSAHGCRLLDFGRTDLEDQGLRDFKSRWGATELPLVYTTVAQRPPRAAGGMARALAPVIRRAPMAVGRLIGEALYHHVA